MAYRLTDNINLHSLTNGEEQTFHESQIASLDTTKAENFADIKPEVKTYKSAYKKMDDSQVRIPKSEFTALIFNADKNRDDIFREMRDRAKFIGNSFKVTEAEKAASVRLEIVFNTYKGAPDQPYDKETGLITNLLQQLNGENKTDIAALGLNDWVIELERLNEEVKKLTAQRVSQMSGNNDVSLKVARAELDAAYKVLISRLDAEIIISRGSNSAVKECIRLFNGTIKRFNNTLAQRSGGKLGSKTKNWSPFYYGETVSAVNTDDEDEVTYCDGMDDIPAWDPNEDYTKMSLGDKRQTLDGRIWEAIDLGQVHRDPAGEFGHFGWMLVE